MTAAINAPALDRLLDLAARSFLAYSGAGATPSVVDDSDRAVDALLKELVAKEKHYVLRAYDLVMDAGGKPAPRPFAFGTSYYNFCRPRTLAERLLGEFDREIAELHRLESAFAPGENLEGRARRLAADFVALRTEGRKRVAETLAKLYPPPPPPAPKPAPAAAPAAKPAAPAAPATPPATA